MHLGQLLGRKTSPPKAPEPTLEEMDAELSAMHRAAQVEIDVENLVTNGLGYSRGIPSERYFAAINGIAGGVPADWLMRAIMGERETGSRSSRAGEVPIEETLPGLYVHLANLEMRVAIRENMLNFVNVASAIHQLIDAVDAAAHLRLYGVHANIQTRDEWLRCLDAHRSVTGYYSNPVRTAVMNTLRFHEID